VTGDGLPEIVINLFNDTGDGQWHAVAIDASSGKTLRDLPRRFLQGTADVDGDGAAEVFCAASEGVAVPSFGKAEILKLKGEPAVIWSRDGAGFALADLPRLGPDWSTTATQGMRHVLLGEEGPRPAFLFRQRLIGIRIVTNFLIIAVRQRDPRHLSTQLVNSQIASDRKNPRRRTAFFARIKRRLSPYGQQGFLGKFLGRISVGALSHHVGFYAGRVGFKKFAKGLDVGAFSDAL